MSDESQSSAKGIFFLKTDRPMFSDKALNTLYGQKYVDTPSNEGILPFAEM
jgi:hypothetical protein